MQTYKLFARLIDVLGARRLAQALGLRRVESVYRLARHPMDADEPDGTGARNDLDRIEAVAEAAVLRPGGRAVVLEIDLWWQLVRDRVLNGYTPEPLTDCRLARKVGASVKEFGEFLSSCDSRELDPARIAKEGAEAIEAIRRLVLAAQAGMQGEE